MWKPKVLPPCSKRKAEKLIQYTFTVFRSIQAVSWLGGHFTGYDSCISRIFIIQCNALVIVCNATLLLPQFVCYCDVWLLNQKTQVLTTIKQSPQTDAVGLMLPLHKTIAMV